MNQDHTLAGAVALSPPNGSRAPRDLQIIPDFADVRAMLSLTDIRSFRPTSHAEIEPFHTAEKKVPSDRDSIALFFPMDAAWTQEVVNDFRTFLNLNNACPATVRRKVRMMLSKTVGSLTPDSDRFKHDFDGIWTLKAPKRRQHRLVIAQSSNARNGNAEANHFIMLRFFPITSGREAYMDYLLDLRFRWQTHKFERYAQFQN